MLEENDDYDDFVDATPEEIETVDAADRRQAEMESHCQDLERQGWRWSGGRRYKGELMHPEAIEDTHTPMALR